MTIKLLWMNHQYKKIRRYLLIGLLIVGALLYRFVQNVRYCDIEEQKKIVVDSKGNKIPLYTDSTTVKKFSELSTKCAYVGDKIECPDIRHLGEAVNRRSILTIARMHAVLDLICKRYKIDYWIFAGTLIGARRNGLMVPWDMDSDIGMMLDDYKRLLKHIRMDLPDDLYFQDGSDNPKWQRVTDAKLRDLNSCYGYCIRNGCEFEDGLQIDIFVFRDSLKDPSLIENFIYKTKFQKSDIYPTKDIAIEGLQIPSPQNSDKILKMMFGPDFTSPPAKERHQCSPSGFMAVPWYSCKHIKSLPKDEQHRVLKDSMDHTSPWFWYH